MMPKFVVLRWWKKLPALEKKFFEKKIIFEFICADMIFKAVCGIFLNKWVSRYLSFVDFEVPKNGSSLQNY